MNGHGAHGNDTRDWLDRAVRELPREKASPDFTRKVMERVRHEDARRPVVTRRVLLAAAAAIVIALTVPTALKLFAGRGGAVASGDPGAERRASIEELLREQQRLASDLASVRDSMEKDSSTIYLGGDDSVDLVLDLGQVARRRYGDTLSGSRGTPGVMPASADGRRR
ncbi:MAG: hypothetical protein OEQ13_00560 [Acidobacteriota bacterium]|nr:hypothetical protein [Acidobacteriota bacterium]